ncbi:hypothetical protein C8J56DRAFT_1103744 [Mycena floridula]|nr:hypothetical protein C8J56DRAFT_1103744 [Mycena floridula]
MHLHPLWETTQQFLGALPIDPTLDALKAQLKQAQAGTTLKALLGQETGDLEKKDEPFSSALAASSKHKNHSGGRRCHSCSRSKSRSGSDDDRPEYHWLEPLNPSDCQCCGCSGHPARFCMAHMPQQICDKILQLPADKKARLRAQANLVYLSDLELSDSDEIKPSTSRSSCHSSHHAAAGAFDSVHSSASDSDDEAFLVGPEQMKRAVAGGHFARVYG